MDIDMDTLAFASNSLLILIAFTIGAAWVTARTARSKGYKFWLFFVLSLLSWFITAVVAIFIKPKGAAKSKVRLSSVLMLTVGALIEFGALSSLPLLDPSMTDEQIIQALSAPESSGSLLVALAGALLVVAGVANDKRSSNA
jgi:cytochrome bd-type quinol oxidase subunit 2